MPGRRRSASRLDDALTQLEEAHVSTIHGFCADLLRERPVEAGVDPLFEVLTEPQSARLFDDAFGRWLQEQLADPPEGVRRALRAIARSAASDGPIDRLRNAGWELDAVARLHRRRGRRDPFDRAAEIDGGARLLHAVADLTRNPSSRSDPLCIEHRAGPPAQRRDRAAAGFRRSGTADYDGWEARPRRSRRATAMLGNVRKGSGASYSDGVRARRAC